MLRIVIRAPSPRMSDCEIGAIRHVAPTWRHVANALFRIYVDTFTAWRHFGAVLRYFGAMWRCEHNFTYHCTSPRGGVATWRQKMANLKFPFAILAPRGAINSPKWRHCGDTAHSPFYGATWRQILATWRHKVRTT